MSDESDFYGHTESGLNRAYQLYLDTIRGIDEKLDYRDAGYKSARLAAEALVGTRVDAFEVWDLACELVADVLNEQRRDDSDD